MIIENIRKLAKAYPDFVYVTDGVACSNTSGGDPKYPHLCGCIVGQALKLAGIEPPPFGTVWQLKHSLKLKLSEDEVNWARCVQNKQDNMATWAEAVDAADDEYPQTEAT